MTASLAALVCIGIGDVRAQGDEPRFDVKRYALEGARAIPTEELERLLEPLIGPQRTFADLQRARETLEAAYARRGYRTVDILLPPQEIQSGVVRIRLVEQLLGQVSIEGNKFFDRANVRASLPGLREGELTDVNAVNRSVRAANENPGKQTAVTFERAPQPGTVNAVVKVNDMDPRRWFASIDNTGAPQTGKLRVAAGVRHANVANSDHVLNFQYVTSPYRPGDPGAFRLLPNSDVTILGLGYRIPLYTRGDAVEFVGGYSNVNSGTLQNLFNVSGSGTTASARYHLNLDRAGEYDHSVAFSADWRDFRSSVVPIGGGSSVVPDITLHPLTVTYTGSLASDLGQTALTLGLSRNLSGGSTGDQAAFNATRAGAAPRYTVWRYGLSHFGALPGDMQWRASIDGQWTRDMLVSGEQFGVGGANSVRGYGERAVSDDRGLRGSLELYSADYGRGFSIGDLHLRLLGFYDMGSVRRVSPTLLETAQRSIASAGFGARLSVGPALSIRFDYGIVIRGAGIESRGDGFLHGSVSYLF